jgi:hypothetical protein
MYENFWTEFLRCLKITKKTYTTPYDWDHRKKQFAIIRTKKYVKVFKPLSYLIFIHMGIMFWNLIQVLRNEEDVVPQIISLSATACAAFTAVSRWMHYKRAENIVHFLNCMVESATSVTKRSKFIIIINECQVN